MCYKIFFTNHGYGPLEGFDTFGEAIARGKKAGFEFTVHIAGGSNPHMIASWSPINGLRMHGEAPEWRWPMHEKENT